MPFLPLINGPVTEDLDFATSAAVPEATMFPPLTPASGPKSQMLSLFWMTSRSCSTTISVLPKSRKRCSALSSRVLSRGWSPIVGSSSTYNTPQSPLPNWLANRIRCASPLDNDAAVRLIVMYCSPTSLRNSTRLLTSRISSPAIFFSRSSSFHFLITLLNVPSGIRQIPSMVKSRKRTAAASSRNRLPPQEPHSTSPINDCIFARSAADNREASSSVGKTPLNWNENKTFSSLSVTSNQRSPVP